MKQAITGRDFGSDGLEFTNEDNSVASLADTAVQYFAYGALLSLAVGMLVVTMMFSMTVAIRTVDYISKPGFFEPEVHAKSITADGSGRAGSFATLPPSAVDKAQKPVNAAGATALN